MVGGCVGVGVGWVGVGVGVGDGVQEAATILAQDLGSCRERWMRMFGSCKTELNKEEPSSTLPPGLAAIISHGGALGKKG